MKFTEYIIVTILCCWVHAECLAQYQKDTLNVLFVGNSYTYFSNMPHLASLMSDSTGTKLVTSKSTAGGARLSHHWRGERGLKTKEIIKNGDFDMVVLQEQSMGTIEQPDSFLIYSRKFCDYIKQYGARPYFYSTWAREKVPQYQKTITEVYERAAQENDAGIIPVGAMWAQARVQRPGIELYAPDGSHPSPLGSFLTACTFVQTLTGELPDRLANSYWISDENGESVLVLALDPLDATYCLKVIGAYDQN